jgi:hypothetical protein
MEKKSPLSKTQATAKQSKGDEQTIKAAKVGEFAFGKENYRLMLIGLALIAVGFLLMVGGGSDDPNVFNPEIFSFRRITLAPILILAGFVVEIFAIMKRPKD